MVWSLYIHSLSRLSLRVLPIRLLCGAGMNPTMWIMRGFLPVWPGDEKCLPIGSFNLLLLMLPKWLTKRSLSFLLVWPTYCFLHVVHVIQYIRL